LDETRRQAEIHNITIVYSRPDAQLRLERFADVLGKAGFRARCVRTSSIHELEDLIILSRPDLVFSASDHLPCETAGHSSQVNVHAWLEGRDSAYIGSPADVLDLALSKPTLKRKWLAEGILTPPFRELRTDPQFPKPSFIEAPPFPCIVKPTDGGNSRGIDATSVVRDAAELSRTVEKLSHEYREILIESYLGFSPDFRELTCACVGNGAERLCLPAEIQLPPGRISKVVTTSDKEEGEARALPISDASLAGAAVALASRIFASLGVRDYARCDLVWAGGRLWSIEVNGQPMIPDPWFGACMTAGGLSEEEYLIAIVMAAAERAAREGRHVQN
jgi:D-alanine-D-alanine ligase-like ATP-grasp enzyme